MIQVKRNCQPLSGKMADTSKKPWFLCVVFVRHKSSKRADFHSKVDVGGWDYSKRLLNYVIFFYLEGLSSEQATCGGWNWLIVTRTITTIWVVKFPGFLWTPFLVCFGWVRVSVGFEDYCGGWLCFYISLGFIGMVTVPWHNQLQDDSETRQAGEERCIFEPRLHVEMELFNWLYKVHA